MHYIPTLASNFIISPSKLMSLPTSSCWLPPTLAIDSDGDDASDTTRKLKQHTI